MRPLQRPSENVSLVGWRVDDCRGQKVGTLVRTFDDGATGAPAWYLVRLRSYSSRYVLVPPADVLATGGRLWLPYDRATIGRAPVLFAPPSDIPPAMESSLRRHFSVPYGGSDSVRVTARRQSA
jgi:hypothetical protein